MNDDDKFTEAVKRFLGPLCDNLILFEEIDENFIQYEVEDVSTESTKSNIERGR